MEFNLEIRKRQLQSLKQYIKSSEDNVKAVFQSLGWTIPKTLEGKGAKVLCPLNKNHLISKKTSKKHLEICELRTAGYDLNEQFLSGPPDKSDYNIWLSNEKKIEILSAAKGSKSDFKIAWNGRDLDPITSDRLSCIFSVDERLALYDYSIKHTKAPPRPQEFTLEVANYEDKKKLSGKDRLVLERDAKRRRAKYKSVHTSKKSQTEIIKEVIDNQMVLYIDWIKQKQEQENKEKEKRRNLTREEIKKQSSNGQNYLYNDQYQYIETTYCDQNTVGQNLQWSRSQPCLYDTHYYSSISTQQEIITDWSHVYRTGNDTDFYLNSGQCQQEENEFTEPTSTIVSTHEPYTSNLKFIEPNNTLNNLYVDQSDEIEGQEACLHLKKTSREKQQYENKVKLKHKNNEGTRYEKVKNSDGSRERRRHKNINCSLSDK